MVAVGNFQDLTTEHGHEGGVAPNENSFRAQQLVLEQFFGIVQQLVGCQNVLQGARWWDAVGGEIVNVDNYFELFLTIFQCFIFPRSILEKSAFFVTGLLHPNFKSLSFLPNRSNSEISKWGIFQI